MKIVLAAFAIFQLVSSSSEGAMPTGLIGPDREVYERALSLCRKDTTVDDPSALDYLAAYATSVYMSPFDMHGPPKKLVHIHRNDLILESFKQTALSMKLEPAQYLRIFLNNDGFYQALEECFPNRDYPDATQLRANFVMELISLDLTGRLWGVNMIVASMVPIGAALGFIKVLSVRAYYLVVGGGIAAAGVGVGTSFLSNYLQSGSVSQLFPHWASAKESSLDSATQGAAALSDFRMATKELDQIQNQEIALTRESLARAIGTIRSLMAKATPPELPTLQAKLEPLLAAQERLSKL